MQRIDHSAVGETVWTDVLGNGLRLCVVPKPGFSTAYAAFATNYGGAHRRFCVDGRMTDTPAGVAHYLEHKMFDMPDGNNALQRLNANGADPNAFTSAGMTCYYFSCTRNFEENLRLLLEFVSTPYFTEETVKKEQGIIAQEIAMGDDDPGSVIYYRLLRLLYAHHPIRDNVAGTVDSIRQITADTLYDCHKVFYAPSNMVLCVEGDVDPEQVRAIAEAVLPREKSSVPVADFGEAEGELPAALTTSRQMQVSAPQFLFGARLTPAEGREQLRQRQVAQLSLRLLLGASSPFYTGLYAKGLLNRDYSYEVDYAADTATVFISGESRDVPAVADALAAEVERVGREGFDAAYFERTKRASLGAKLRGLEYFESVCLSLAEGLFAGYDALEAPAVLSEITAAECVAFIRDTLNRDRLALSVILPGRE